MPNLKLDALSVVSGDLMASAKFYALLGFSFPQVTPEDKHIEALDQGSGLRLMIDDRGLMESLLGQAPTPASHASFALKCANAAEVDSVVALIVANGYRVVKQPWDAFWGQRYAVIADPYGYMVDLFAPL